MALYCYWKASSLPQFPFTNNDSRVFEEREVRFIIHQTKKRTGSVSLSKKSPGAPFDYLRMHVSEWPLASVLQVPSSTSPKLWVLLTGKLLSDEREMRGEDGLTEE
jgi:hypothetical protein